jgi:hypothetical protein
MAKSSSAAKQRPVAQKPIQQMFKVDPGTYRKIRMLAAARSGTGKAATGQDIFLEALNEYLERNTKELPSMALVGSDE